MEILKRDSLHEGGRKTMTAVGPASVTLSTSPMPALCRTAKHICTVIMR
jgi:hypothetical protein